MQKVKIFKSVETDISALETEVNRWLSDGNFRVLNMFGNIAPQSQSAKESAGLTGSMFAPSDILLVILYESA